jgi:diguanylate cyclase (GGDEF)-like protein
MSTTRLSPLHEARSDQSIRVLVAGDQNLYDSACEALDTEEVSLIESAKTSDALMDKLSQAGFDCIVVDQNLGRQSSLALHETIAAKYANPPPMIMLARGIDANTAINAFRNGFSDYVSRDHNYAKELIQAIRRAVRRSRKTQALLGEVEHLSKMAKYDRLTGLPNRSFLEDRLMSLIASGERHGNEFSLFLIDINNFRQINDIYGHAVGDQALKAFAKKLMLAARSSDALGRFGGDEFLYLIDRDVSYETVERACNRLASALAFAIELDAVGLSLSASIGAAIFPSDGATPDELLTSADHAMYAAKASGAGYCLVRAMTAPSGSPSQSDQVAPGAADWNEQTPTSPPGGAGTVTPQADGPSVAERGDRQFGFSAATDATAEISRRVGHRNENRRAERRNRVFKRGRIIFGDGFSTIDCMIRDLSTRGARISVEDQLVVPMRFSFAVLDSGEVYSAARRWQRGRSIGVEFLNDGPTVALRPLGQKAD